jgi:hypothetical protein
MPGALLLPFALVVSLQAPDPKVLAEDLTRKYLEQRSFSLTYSLRTQGAPEGAPPVSTVEVAVDLPRGKCLMTLHLTSELEAGPVERHYFLEGLLLRSWGSGVEPVEIDFEASAKEYRDSYKALIRTLLQLAPATDTSELEFLPWLPAVRLGLSKLSSPQAYCDLMVGVGPALCGNVGSWLNALRYLEKVDLKEKGDLYEFALPDGRVFRTERETGILRAFQSRNADGSVYLLSLVQRRIGGPFPTFTPPTTFKRSLPPPEWDRQLGDWNTQILERVVRSLAASPKPLRDDSDKTDFLVAVTRSAALSADCLENTFLRQNARDQVAKLLKSGLTSDELRGDASGLRAGYITSYENGREAFQNNLWKSLDETVFLEIRMGIREALKTSGSPLEFAVRHALEREALAPFRKQSPPEQIGGIFIEELERVCGK